MNLVPLFEEALEFQNFNGSVLSNGKVAVFYIGRTRLADIFNDIEGLSPAENPKVLDNLGMGPLYVNPAFDYELIVYDAYDNEMFSVKKYLHSKGEHSTANVIVTPSENIAVSAWTQGDVQVYMPYLTGDVGKTYEGIAPIVVNNEYNRISANHIPLGVQDPLYFVEDSESACIIGMSGGTVPEGTMTESGLGFENNKITGYNGSAFSAGNDYVAGSYVDITDNTISVTGLSPLPADMASTGLVASVSADITAMIPDTSDMATQTWVNEQGFLTAHQDISNKLDTTAFSTVSGNFLTAHQSLEGYATEQWVENKGYITGVDIPESANWNEATTVVNNNSAIWNNTTNIVSANSAQWAGSTANPQIPVTGINGIKISESGDKVVFEVSADYAVAADLTGKQDSLTFGYKDTAISSINNSALYDNSAHARITTLAGRISNLSSNKLDSSAFSDVSGSFLTTVPATYLQNTDLTITDGKVTEISGVPLSAGDELPSGVMNTSALEYNAVNEISGYNGSAIAQYGAEKQWLQHDDTLVHAANSAQYALGVNLSAIAQLLGIDETILYSGYENIGSDGAATYNLTELPTNFNKIKIYWGLRDNTQYAQGNKGFGSVEYDTNLYSADYTYIAGFMEGSTDNTSFTAYRYDANIANIRTTSWSQNGQLTRLNDNTILANNAVWFHIYKIVGIGRKS